MSGSKSYHHGDLRAALLAAAEAELTQSGLESFSLRRVAKRVGVSHAAPAHHFGDASGLLSALASDGFRRFCAAMEARQARAGSDPRARTIASALGYVDFATASPALFRLMFASDRLRSDWKGLSEAGAAAYAHLVSNVTALRGHDDPDDPDGRETYADTIAHWSIVHGYAELFVSGRMQRVQAMSPEEREAFLSEVFARVLR